MSETRTQRPARLRATSGQSVQHRLPRFQVWFAERLYDGAPRWFNGTWQEHVRRVDGDREGTLDREPGVQARWREAHNRLLFYGQVSGRQSRDTTDYLLTCVNPSCSARTHGRITAENRDMVNLLAPREKWGALKALAQGRPQDLPESCPTCGQGVYLLPAVPIRDKWIYVLKEEGGSLHHYCEVFARAPVEGPEGVQFGGMVYTQMAEGRYVSEGAQPFEGYLNLLPDPTQHPWHFFLSPVRLGPEALRLLLASPDHDRRLASAREGALPEGIDWATPAGLQPWATTVKRSFARAPRGRVEIIPLVDPFAWAAQLVDFDYLPILAAQQKLVRDADEQAKAFVAATLQQAIGRRMVSEDPPAWEEDSWDVADDTLPVPSGAEGSNIAEAWTRRYRAALEYLGEETNRAGLRLVMLLRYSLAHRIVEQACQEGGDRLLSLGLVHWAHVLRDLLGCQEGQRFIAWLTGDGGDADDPLRPAARIPIRNVREGEGIRGPTEAARRVGDGILLTISTTLAPGTIARSRHPARDMGAQLGNINIPTQSLGTSDLLAARDLALDVSAGLIEHYQSILPEGPNYRLAHRRAGLNTWSERLTLYGHVSQLEKALTLLIALKDYHKEGRTYETGYDRFARMRDYVETPIKVADFLARNTREVLKARMNPAQRDLVERLSQEGRRIVGALSTDEYELLVASRSVRAYQFLGTGARVLAGPVGLVLGGVEMVSQSMQTIDAWEASDPGAAVGHGIQAVAGVLVIAVAAAECAALLTGAAVASWAGPVGWIAAGFMLLGSVVLAVWSKNDLELFARHCFLGPAYGEGDWDDQTGKSWMAGQPWPALRYASGRRESPERWQRQRLALLRLIAGFKTYIGPSTYSGGIVYPTYQEGGLAFEVKVDVMPQGQTSPRESYRAVVWPRAREYAWLGPAPGSGSYVSFSPARGDAVTSFTVQAEPRRLGVRLVDYELRVRLIIDPEHGLYLPASGAFVTNSTVRPGIYSIQDSTSVD